MEKIIRKVKRGWRAGVTATFVLLVFTVPASKGILGAFFGVKATPKDNANRNNKLKLINEQRDNINISASYSSHGSPSSQSDASPVKPTDSCSTGLRHTRSHHGHRGHSHYRPNGR